MQRWLLLLLLLCTACCYGQRGMIFIKKRGVKKVATFWEGAPIRLQLDGRDNLSGYISRVGQDTVFVNGLEVPVARISRVYIRSRQDSKLASQLLWATAGVALATTGMTLAKWASFEEALKVNAGMAYAPIAYGQLRSLKRMKYRIGRKFQVQAIDLHFNDPPPR
jgi:hypothetical protein